MKNTNTREYGIKRMTVEVENPDKEVDDRSGRCVTPETIVENFEKILNESIVDLINPTKEL